MIAFNVYVLKLGIPIDTALLFIDCIEVCARIAKKRLWYGMDMTQSIKHFHVPTTSDPLEEANKKLRLRSLTQMHIKYDEVEAYCRWVDKHVTRLYSSSRSLLSEGWNLSWCAHSKKIWNKFFGDWKKVKKKLFEIEAQNEEILQS